MGRGEINLAERLPGADHSPDGAGGSSVNPILAGRLIPGHAASVNLPGWWPQFRGPSRDNVAADGGALRRSWDSAAPRPLWSVTCGEGYGGAAVRGGRVYILDYDYDQKLHALRCLSLADGGEIWRFAYKDPVKRNHGVTRTIPAVNGKYVVAMDPKCHVLCLDAASGALRWSIDLAVEFGATVPQWYAGQCPLIDGSAVILAPGGPDALLLAVDLETGKPIWRSPNPHDWKMTHSSVMPMEFAGRKFYLYCASGGVVGISATNGAQLWETPDWKISIATVPSPLALNDGKILLSGGYKAGSLLLQLREKDGHLQPETVWRLGPEIFGATQHTPIFHNGAIYGVRPNGQFVCLGLDGKVVWTSRSGTDFGLGSFLCANGVFFAMNDSGKLTMMEDSPSEFRQLGEAQVLDGGESWGPMALAGGRLLVRDFTHLVCLDVAAPAIASTK